jgi:hypothetical protein
MLIRVVVAAVAFFSSVIGALAQDGARAYFLLPEDTNIISLTMNLLHTEVAGSEFDAAVLTPSYRRSIELFGNAGSVLIGIPVGSLDASLATPIGVIDLETDPAQGDLFVGAALGLVGSPSLSLMEFAQYKPGFRAGVAAKLFLPTGDYDSNRLLNLGGNRWSLELSLPISYVLADTMIDPELTTFELVPVVQFLGDNDDPFGPANIVSQDPLFSLQGHITRNLSRTVWASIDGTYKYGGELSSDGVDQGNTQEVVTLGATLGWSPTPALALRASFEQTVYSKLPDSSGHLIRATAAYRF